MEGADLQIPVLCAKEWAQPRPSPEWRPVLTAGLDFGARSERAPVIVDVILSALIRTKGHSQSWWEGSPSPSDRATRAPRRRTGTASWTCHFCLSWMLSRIIDCVGQDCVIHSGVRCRLNKVSDKSTIWALIWLFKSADEKSYFLECGGFFVCLFWAGFCPATKWSPWTLTSVEQSLAAFLQNLAPSFWVSVPEAVSWPDLFHRSSWPTPTLRTLESWRWTDANLGIQHHPALILKLLFHPF